MLTESNLPRRIIVALSQGRSGTKYLSHVMSLFSETASLHEPHPNFTQHSLIAQHDQNVAKTFLITEKLPAIASYRSYETYVETSHMWCSGLADAWLDLNLSPSLEAIILDRPVRAIARSIYELGMTPGETPWYIDPLAPSCLLKFPTAKKWGRYAKCYAYCLEIEARKAQTHRRLRENKRNVVRIDVSELHTWAGIFKLKNQLRLRGPTPSKLYTFCFLKRRVLNTQKYVKKSARVSPLSQQEMQSIEEDVQGALSNTQWMFSEL